jgi:hypothetical protein
MPDSESDASGTTVGVWIPEDSDVVEEFDRVVCDGEARSKQLREAMELLIAVEEVLDDAGYSMTGRDRRMWVRQACLDRVRAETKSE